MTVSSTTFAAPIVAVGPTSHELLVLQRVEEGDHGGAIDAQVPCGLLLRLRLSSGQEEQHRQFTRVDAQRREMELVQTVELRAPARFVLASTSNVYDADASRPSREDDACSPTAAYPASRLAAEALLRDSALNWSILRFPFVDGDGDGHLASMPAHAARMGLHPAQTFSVAHHRDIATAVRLALKGTMGKRVVNVTDDAPVTVYDMAAFAGTPIEGSHEPLTNPWSGRIDGALARELGFEPSVPTISDAARRGIL